MEKKPIYKKWWFWLIIVILIGAIGSASGKGKTDPNNTASTNVESNAEAGQNTVEATTEPVSYTVCDAATLIKELEGNALRASDTYKGKYVQIQGKLSNIDSSGKYISIEPNNDDFVITNIQCFVTNDAQKTVIAGLNIDDVITIKGQITDVGELMGYSLDIDEIIK